MKFLLKIFESIENHQKDKINLIKLNFIIFSALILFITSLAISRLQSYDSGNSSYNHFFLDITARTLLAPTAETIIFQLAPFLLAKRWKVRPLLTLFMMTVPFSCLHSYLGIAGMFAAFVAGIIFSLSLIFWSAFSLRQGFFITTLIHMLHNTLAEIWNNFIN